MGTVIVYNPGAGRSRARGAVVQRMVDALGARGLSAAARATSGAGDATRLAREAALDGAEVVIACGGDGTINEVLQGVVGSTACLGVWPRGTANVLAWEMGLPRRLEAIADVVAAGHTRRVSIGRAGDRYFILMAGIGLDAAVVRRVNPTLKRFLGQGAYWLAALRQLAAWPPLRFCVEADGRVEHATLAVLANAARYGGGLRFAPRARMDDDLFDICLLDSTDRLRLIRYVLGAFSGAHLGLPGVTYLQARRVRAHGAGAPWVQVDGEPAGRLPMEFECVPAAVSVLAPR
ncbi:MAG: diacylglycerol kinase family lipid kinase [Candidatus Rokubacteria bacterium]|nr:diacylglycerol kinase family lipid kinase [Candidatus Rokubacteria bacterium]